MPVFLAFFLGIFSMGFQLLGSRLLNPWFGSSLIVWAFIISVFLAGFSLGSIVGGLAVRGEVRFRRKAVGMAAGVAVTGLSVNAALAPSLLEWLDATGAPLPAALGVACGVLFLPPVTALAAFTPVLVQMVHDRGSEAGFASGLVYCVSTLGNIAGIMATAFVLIPHVPVSVLLWIWTASVAVASCVLMRCVR